MIQNNEMQLGEETFSQYILVITGMAYIIDPSGTSNVVKAHENAFLSAGIDYIVMFPISRSKGEGVHWRVKTTGCYGLVVNGKYRGVYTAVEVLNTLLSLQENGSKCIGILVHHLIRNNIREVESIVHAIQNVRVVFYLHDFYSCCVNPNRMKNDSVSCVDGDVPCEGCRYAKKKEKHLKNISGFFASVKDRISFVAPSEFVKSRWLLVYPEYEGKVLVVPHQKTVSGDVNQISTIAEDHTLRIAFVGAQKVIKGWDAFESAVMLLDHDKHDYAFYSFGKGGRKLDRVTNVSVDVALQGKDAMIHALKDHRIDIVFLGSVCGETYSYTLFESHAANCFIVTPQKSGNIAFVVQAEGWGIVLNEGESFLDLLNNESALRNAYQTWLANCPQTEVRYVDNDAIISVFEGAAAGNVVWKRKQDLFVRRLKRKALDRLFYETRVKGKVKA